MEVGLFLIFWYGVLHAFGPDHLAAIADFSIGKDRKKTMMITLLFAVGHGVTLFLFVKLLEYYPIAESISGYGDIISSMVIIGMGAYLLFLVATDRIQLRLHSHNGKEHTHIWFGKNHSHEGATVRASAFSIGALMGLGGVRGMLVTLGMLGGESVDMSMILAFIVGVTVVFSAFGLVILYINSHFLSSKVTVRKVFTIAGLLSVGVGVNMLLF